MGLHFAFLSVSSHILLIAPHTPISSYLHDPRWLRPARPRQPGDGEARVPVAAVRLGDSVAEDVEGGRPPVQEGDEVLVKSTVDHVSHVLHAELLCHLERHERLPGVGWGGVGGLWDCE